MSAWIEMIAERDAEITAGARPVYRSEALLFDPRRPELQDADGGP